MEKLVNPYVLLEKTDEPDCRFVAAWLTKAAEAQDFWSEALTNPDFANQVALLRVMAVPHLAACALEIFAELVNQSHVAAVDLYSDEIGLRCSEYTLLVQLGFFVCVDESYRMAVPKTITLEKVKQAALSIMSTTGDVGDAVDAIQPELLLHTLPQTQAHERRHRLIELRNFSHNPPYHREIH